MKKLFLALAVAIAGVVSANAQLGFLSTILQHKSGSYNRVGLSYDLTHFSDIDNSANINGVGVNFMHGIKFTGGVFAEAGVEFNVQAGGKQDYTFTSFQVPVNFGYSFPDIVHGAIVSPYAGFNIKMNTSGTANFGDLKDINLFDKDDLGTTYNRLQPGWHLGVGARMSNYFASIEFGTDFRAVYHEGENTISTSNFKLGVGYCF